MNNQKEFIEFLLERYEIERKKFDRTGVYAYTQRLLAYNSNKIEGSTLTEEQTASLFDNGTLPKTDNFYRAKDVEEMNGHFLMFNHMIDTLKEPLNEKLVKAFHFELKSGVFEDRANGYAIGEYKKRPNIIGIYETTRPDFVEAEMQKLLNWYSKQKIINILILAEFHARYECIHPFQDGNGRTGRLILFRECLKNRILPIVIEDDNRQLYLSALSGYREGKDLSSMSALFKKEQDYFFERCSYFI